MYPSIEYRNDRQQHLAMTNDDVQQQQAAEHLLDVLTSDGCIDLVQQIRKDRRIKWCEAQFGYAEQALD